MSDVRVVNGVCFRAIIHPKYEYQLVKSVRIWLLPSVSRNINWSNGYLEVISGHIVEIKAGYAWDGATGIKTTDNLIRASLIHDAMYQLIREGILSTKDRKSADQLMYKNMLADGVSRFKAALVYAAIRLCGWYYVRSEK